MALFRKKPVVVEAMQVPPPNDVVPWGQMVNWLHEANAHWRVEGRFIHIRTLTLEGKMTARTGDWIIRYAKDEWCVCDPDTFAATYEEVQE